jgi:hypothetical protein
MMNILRAFILFFVIPTFTHAQQDFPKGYFVMPINPGQVTSLSGCFGDLRTNHFHSGLDVRTGGAEGKRVVAAADGYVSRIRVQNGGYGNVLYITHPNGYTTVYAHLKDFNDELGQYLTEKQYEKKTWEIDLEVPKDLFKYNQGELVALSGNTGGSGGPHLHFEIRDQKENAIDPQLFGFKEIRDITAPVIELISLKCMSADARINGKFGIFNFKPIKRGNEYVLPQSVKATGLIGVEILTYDKAANSPFRLGVHDIELKMNGNREYKFNLDKMGFHNKLDMNVHVNYEKMIKNNQKIHKCYLEESNSFDFYESNNNWGKLKIENPSNAINIRVRDTYENTSNLNFKLLKDNSTTTTESANITTATVLDEYLKVVTPTQENELVIVTNAGKEIKIPMLSSASGAKSAIYNMEEGFPEKVLLGSKDVILPVNTAVTLENPLISIPGLIANFTGTLYDDAYISVEVSDDELVMHEDIIPLKGSAEVQWTKSGTVNYPDKQKVYLDGAKRKFIGGEWSNKTITFKTREFGTYLTLYDFEPPVITPRTVDKNNLRFTISDKLSGISKIECYINDEWILMDYEYKTGAIWSRKLDYNKPFTGKLVLKITDKCNNTQSYETIIL